MSKGVSFIISARNEYPQIVMTITNLMMDCYQSGIDYEFIIADNGSTDNTTAFFRFAHQNPYGKNSPHQVIDEFKHHSRGMVTDGKIKFVYDPVFSNVGARDKAVQYAQYDNIIFADAHISVKPGTVAYMLETLEEYGGIVHSPVGWMGADIHRPGAGIQYTYKIGEKIWGTWNRIQISSDHPFYIPVSGHCFIAVNKKEYESFGGYDTHQQVYGGGENYLDTLYWMMGSNVMVDPRALVFHLSAGRGYSYNMAALIHNMILTSYTLGGMKWAERIYITYLNKKGTDKQYLKELYEQAIREGEEKRKFIKENAKYTLDEVLGLVEGDEWPECDGHCYKNQAHRMRIWDKMNEEMLGKHLSFVVVFDDWLERLTDPEAIQLFENSPHQQS